MAIGSGCIAALEAEKWLSEQEVVEPNNPLGKEAESKDGVLKGENDAAPEYRRNPLL